MPDLRRNDAGEWLCSRDDCEEVAVHGWERADEHGNRIPVYGCDPHSLDDDARGLLHQPGCQAPPECTCDQEALLEHARQLQLETARRRAAR